MFGYDLTLQTAAMRLFAGLIIAAVHGFTLAAVAVALGDKGPKYDGRLTPSPFRHTDVGGLAALVLTGFGWSRPVAIDPDEMRPGRWGLPIAPLAGSVALLFLALMMQWLLLPALSLLPHTAAITASAFLRTSAELCIWIALFSLLPVPPLAGGHLLAAAGIHVPQLVGVVAAWALFILSFAGAMRTMLAPAYDVLAPFVLGPDFAIR